MIIVGRLRSLHSGSFFTAPHCPRGHALRGSRPSAALALASGTLVCGTAVCYSVSATTSGALDSAHVRPARQQQSEMSMRTLATPKPGFTPVFRYKDGVVTIDRLLRVDVVADDTVANQASIEFELGRATTHRVVHWDYVKLPTIPDQSISEAKAEALAHFDEEAVSLIDSISANELARGQRAAPGTWLIWVHEMEAPKRVAFPTTPAASCKRYFPTTPTSALAKSALKVAHTVQHAAEDTSDDQDKAQVVRTMPAMQAERQRSQH